MHKPRKFDTKIFLDKQTDKLQKHRQTWKLLTQYNRLSTIHKPRKIWWKTVDRWMDGQTESQSETLRVLILSAPYVSQEKFYDKTVDRWMDGQTEILSASISRNWPLINSTSYFKVVCIFFVILDDFFTEQRYWVPYK